MTIAIVATEFPPSPGGMQEHALGLATSLSCFHDVIVYTNVHHDKQHYPLPLHVKPILENNIYDFERLKCEKPHIFLTLNAGYAYLSTVTDIPVFSYCHGNDFLCPWIRSEPAIINNLIGYLSNTTYFWRHKSRLSTFARPFLHRNIKRGLGLSRAIYVNSEYTMQLIKHRFPGLTTPIAVIPPGIPKLFFDPFNQECQMLKRSPDWNFLTVSRLSQSHRKSKNLHNLIYALAKLKEQVKFTWTLVGDGDMRQELEQLVANSGMNDRTYFVGNIPNIDLRQYYDVSDALLLPSLETFGIVYVEAAARGVPSLGRQDSGATEAIRDGQTGILIPDESTESILLGIQRLISQPSQWDPHNIRAFADNFTWQKSAQWIYQDMAERVFK